MKQLLRFVTSGSVDDGKSTLIGRLLYETKNIYQDQYKAVEQTSKRMGKPEIDFALLLDGLSSEREQGITIDVAYRYFSTSRRKFIIADTPGHEQYTKNMVTGASTAALAIILVDARKGVLSQSKRHSFILSMLLCPHLVVAINKMDLVEFNQEIYEQIVDDFCRFSRKLMVQTISFMPISALKGDNITRPSANMPWYKGPTLLHLLENVDVSTNTNSKDFRFPVQYIIRPHQDFRGYAGKVISGIVRVGDHIVVLPSKKTTTIKSIITYDKKLQQARAGQSVVLTIEDENDISRGDCLVHKDNFPQIDDQIDAIICWMDEEPTTNNYYYLKHTTNTTKTFVKTVLYKINIDNLQREDSMILSKNEIGRVLIKTTQPIFFDCYQKNCETGRFILINPLTNQTSAVGMIGNHLQYFDQDSTARINRTKKSSNITWEENPVKLHEWEKRNGHPAAVLWLTGLSASGKSSIARTLVRKFFEKGCQVMFISGDNIRHGLCGDLQFSEKDREENIRRTGHAAKLFFDNGHIVLCAFISPYKKGRQFIRKLFPPDRFIEVYTKCSLEVCRKRDSKGLYQKALNGEIKNFTGISSPYQEPENPEILIETDFHNVEQSVDIVLNYLKKHLFSRDNRCL